MSRRNPSSRNDSAPPVAVGGEAGVSDDDDGTQNPRHDGAQQSTAAATTEDSNSTNLFVTPSDVLRRLNASLAEQLLVGSDDSEQQQQSQKPQQSQHQSPPSLFELQKRLPDGSAVPATAADRAAFDWESQFQQAAAVVAALPTVTEKMAWAERQRQAGNKLHHQNRHREALDAYLTCLTVAADFSLAAAAAPSNKEEATTTTMETNNDDDENPNENQHDDQDTTTATTQQQQQQQQREQEQDAMHMLFAKVMNNLALTTLQLQWYGKTVQFCNMALQQLATVDDEDDDDVDDKNNNSNNNNNEMCAQRSKLHYLRAKASRLRGEYERAVLDLDAADRWLFQIAIAVVDDAKNETTTSQSQTQRDFGAAIQRERKLLQRAQVEARRHAAQQKRALQQLLQSPSQTTKANDETNESATTKSAPAPLYESTEPSDPRQRPYSTLRAPKEEEEEEDEDDENDGDSALSYWQRYLQMVGRGAQRLLDWLDERERLRQQQQQQRRYYGGDDPTKDD